MSQTRNRMIRYHKQVNQKTQTRSSRYPLSKLMVFSVKNDRKFDILAELTYKRKALVEVST